MKTLLALAAFLTLAACALYPPGVDPNGQKLQAAAMPVLEAIHNYIHDNQKLPKSLDVLVPKYIAGLPDKPKLTYDLDHNVVTFHYIQSLSSTSDVVCSAFIGQTAWSCQ